MIPLPVSDVRNGKEIFVEIMKLYDSDDDKKCWSQKTDKQGASVVDFQSNVMLSKNSSMK